MSFLRGERREARAQKETSTGIKVRMAKNSQVFHPPPTLLEKYRGIRALREKRRMLEKVSLPAASAGRGAFLIDGY